MRVKITLACTECKQRNYNTMKNKKNSPDRLEMNKYCRFCKNTLFTRKQNNGGTSWLRKSLKMQKQLLKKPNVFKRLAKYLGSCKSEIKKITWPTAKQTTKNFGIVIAMVAIVGVFIFALDQGLYALVGLFMNTTA